MLCVAARYGHADVMRTVIRYGADIKGLKRAAMKVTAIHMVANGGDGNVRLVGGLLEAGAEVDPMFEREITPLEFTVHRGSFEVLRELFKRDPCYTARWTGLILLSKLRLTFALTCSSACRTRTSASLPLATT